MGVIASVLLMLAGLFTVHGHTLNTTGNATVQADVTVDPSVTPTDTPTVTPTPTDVTVTPTVTPSVEPTATPTVQPTVTPTATVSPTVTPTVVPSVSPTPIQQEDGDKDDMLGLKADVHALFGLMNAAFHHEQNESRFEAKHGQDRDGK